MINRENGRGGEEERKWFVDAGEERLDIKDGDAQTVWRERNRAERMSGSKMFKMK